MKMYSDLPYVEDKMSRMNFKRTTQIKILSEEESWCILEAFVSHHP